jgi:aerobic C4-dicarboxylate transport protein
LSKSGSIYRTLYSQVFLAIIIGVVFGYAWPRAGSAFKPVADGFINLMRMMVAPVVFCTIVLGIAGMRDMKAIGKSLVKALGLFYLLTAISLVIGLAAVYLFRPGVGMNVDPSQLDATVASQYTTPAASRTLVDFLQNIIPQSFFGAFAEGNILSVLLLALIVGAAIPRAGAVADPLLRVIHSFLQVLFAAFGFLIKLSPIGAFAAMAFTVGRYGIQSLTSLALLVVTFYAGCLFFIVVVIGSVARLHRFSLWELIRYFKDELMIIFGTSTSEPVVPRLLQKLEDLGCEKRIVGLVLPMSYSFNLDGIAIFLTVATVFIAQACNIHLTWERILTMLLVMLLTTKGAAGVAGSGFVALIATFAVMPDIPVAGVALIVGVDRFMSGGRAVTSTISNAVATIVVSSWESALDRTVLKAQLARSKATTYDDSQITIVEARDL